MLGALTQTMTGSVNSKTASSSSSFAAKSRFSPAPARIASDKPLCCKTIQSLATCRFCTQLATQTYPLAFGYKQEHKRSRVPAGGWHHEDKYPLALVFMMLNGTGAQHRMATKTEEVNEGKGCTLTSCMHLPTSLPFVVTRAHQLMHQLLYDPFHGIIRYLAFSLARNDKGILLIESI